MWSLSQILICMIMLSSVHLTKKNLELKFDMLGPLPQDTIRKILLNNVHDFLNNINSDSELCPYLKNGNMNICDVGITLFFHDTKGYHIHEPEIGIASISKGEVE